MTRLAACVLRDSAVEGPAADVTTVEVSGPALRRATSLVIIVPQIALLLLATIATENVLFRMPAITTSRHSDFAGTAQALMANGLMRVLTTWH